jgi:hypothetical protein
MYSPDSAVFDGTYELPPIVRASTTGVPGAVTPIPSTVLRRAGLS